MKRVLLVLTVVALVLVGTWAAFKPPHLEHAEARASRSAPPSTTTTTATPMLTPAQAQSLGAYMDSIKFDEFLQSTNAFLASLAPPPVAQAVPAPAYTVPSYAPVASGGATGACGGATNGADQFIQRESGGDPNALNPSGAWGCYQIMPGTWAGAGCNDLGAYGSASAAVQAECASRLSLSAWNE